MLILYFISAAEPTVTTKSTTMKPTSKKLNVCIFNSIETVVKCFVLFCSQLHRLRTKNLKILGFNTR